MINMTIKDNDNFEYRLSGKNLEELMRKVYETNMFSPSVIRKAYQGTTGKKMIEMPANAVVSNGDIDDAISLMLAISDFYIQPIGWQGDFKFVFCYDNEWMIITQPEKNIDPSYKTVLVTEIAGFETHIECVVWDASHLYRILKHTTVKINTIEEFNEILKSVDHGELQIKRVDPIDLNRVDNVAYIDSNYVCVKDNEWFILD